MDLFLNRCSVWRSVQYNHFPLSSSPKPQLGHLPIPRRENITSASEAVCTTLFFPTQTSACLSANYVSVIKPIKFHNLKYTKIDSEKDKNDMWCLLSLQSIWFGISLECLRGCQLELRLESRRLCRVEQRVSSKQLRRKLIWRATLFKM